MHGYAIGYEEGNVSYPLNWGITTHPRPLQGKTYPQNNPWEGPNWTLLSMHALLLAMKRVTKSYPLNWGITTPPRPPPRAKYPPNNPGGANLNPI